MPGKKTNKQAHASGIEIPERTDILRYLHECAVPRSLKEIAQALDARTSDERAALNKRLKAMLRDGEIIKNRREGYGLVNKMNLVTGKVIGHADGYGFLRPDKEGDDIFMPAGEMRSLLHGDRVVVRIAGQDRKGRSKGAVVEVLDRANTQVVGRYFQEDHLGYVVPDNKRLHQDIFIPQENAGEARSGQHVVASITRYPDRHTQPVGKIIEILEAESDTRMVTEVAIRSHDLPHEWSPDLLQETRGLDPAQPLNLKGRTDLRDLWFITIDGEDARDFDDAVYCEEHGEGWRLLVAIADVSAYVKPGSELDAEAEARGTSVYFPNRVVPMLPEVLSNELCSLKPDVERLVLACDMQVTRKGKIKKYSFCDAVIRSRARMTYTQVQEIHDGHAGNPRDGLIDIARHIENLFRLYKRMHGRRQRLGLLDFNATESTLVFDDAGHVTDVLALVRTDAHRLIEEFMLAANVCAAEFLLEKEIPALFRNHEQPSADKLADLREFLSEFGLSLSGQDEPDAGDYADLIEQVNQRDDAHLIETVLLRSMMMAFYGEENLGHFGLAFDAYTHFTSPIRRYPDLLVHRAIKSVVHNNPGEYGYTTEDVHKLGVDCSHTERRAEDASRQVVQKLKCIFMQDHVGKEYAGTVSSVTGFGLFVELDGIFIEGLVHVTSLPLDYYHFDPISHLLRGEKTHREFRLANRVRVRVMRVDVEDAKIDFELVDTGTKKRGAKRRRKGR